MVWQVASRVSVGLGECGQAGQGGKVGAGAGTGCRGRYQGGDQCKAYHVSGPNVTDS